MTVITRIKKSKNVVRFLLIVFTLIVLLFNFKRELISVNDGKGWDGSVYYDVTVNSDSWYNKSLNQYQVQRILVPVLVNVVLETFSIEKNIYSVVNAYRIFNFLCIFCAIIIYFKISNKLSLSSQNEVLGFVCLFWNFPILKLNSFYPILTDIASFFLGLLFVYYYLNQKVLGMLSVFFLGSFVFPTFLLFLPCIFIRKAEIIDNHIKTRLESFLLPFFLLLLILYVSFFKESKFLSQFNGTSPINTSFILLSILISTSYIYFVGKAIPTIKRTFLIFKQIDLKYFFLSLATFVVVLLIRKYVSSNSNAGYRASDFLINITKQSISNPGIFIVAHTVYYGFFCVLIFLFRIEIRKILFLEGFGILVLVAAISFLALGSESRQIINFYPFIVIIVIRAKQISEKIFSNQTLVLFILITLISSCFWVNLSFNLDSIDSTNFLEYPAQKYFRFQGPWMSNQSYYLYALIYCFILGILYIMNKKKLLWAK